MRYLNMYRDETCATATDKKVIPSNYLDRPDFDMAVPLHSGLHYAFMRGVAKASYSKGYDLRMAINVFLDFAAEHNDRVPLALRINSLNDIGVEEFLLFEQYLLKNGLRVYLAIRLSSVLKAVGRNFDDGAPLLKLPMITEPEFDATEPLGDQVDKDFYEVMYREVDLIRKKMKFQKEISLARPYDKWEVWELSDDLYKLKKGARSDWVIDSARALSTLAHEGFPFFLQSSWFNALERDARTSTLSSIGRTPLEFVMSCSVYKGFLKNRAPGCLLLSELLHLEYPTAQDQATLALFIQRQLGWNKETVLALDKDNFVHPLSELAKHGTVLIISEKNKSQAQGLPYTNPKVMLATSSKDDPYSAYNLIKLAIEISEDCRRYVKSDPNIEPDDPRQRSPFLVMAYPQQPWVIEERFQPLDNKRQWDAGVAAFLDKAKLVDNGTPISKNSDLNGRLRVTSQQSIKQKHSHPIGLTALIHGHTSPVTTEVYYDSSAYADRKRRTRFHEFQEKFVKFSQAGQFQGVMGNIDSSSSKSPRFRIFTIMGHERPLWACMDSSNPIYPNHQPLPPGSRCTRLDKCNGCSQWYVLEDSLPFLIERVSTLELQIEKDPGSVTLFNDEVSILKYILNNWGKKEAIAAATAYRNNFEALLPLDLKALIAFIED